MLQIKKLLSVAVCMAAFAGSAQAQALFRADTVQAGKFDNGKMWTFDAPPKAYWKQTYGFEPTDEWLENVRLSALRFASWCSASFVSANGLVMTNHHCSRDVATKVQKAGENFNENGFYAAKLSDERRVPDLYVDQLVKMEDITARVQKAMDSGKDDNEQIRLRDAELAAIRKEYADKEGWKGLELQTITFYNGGRYSLYGFKRYKDVRLVMIPELQLGYYGGDYDNFTYPRYCLDFTFWRVYDDNGQPLQTRHYFKFNPSGAQEGEVTFVVGNPGRTSRQFTVADLEFLRDIQIPAQVLMLRNQSAALKKVYHRTKSDSLLNMIFSMENTIKARSGALKALQDPYIIARRAAFERQFKAAAMQKHTNAGSIWDAIANYRREYRQVLPPVLAAQAASTAFQAAQMIFTLAKPNTMDANTVKRMSEQIEKMGKPAEAELEADLFRADVMEVVAILGEDDMTVKQLLQGKTAAQFADDALKTTQVYDASFRKSLIEKGMTAINDSQDPVVRMAALLMPRVLDANQKIPALNNALNAQRSKLARLLYDLYGTSIPPDATFSLRISDGIVKGYEYNGTKAPATTNFYGLFELNTAFGQNSDWRLPKRWLEVKRTPEFLAAPLNFVSTNDIIGGNSGSPMINRKGEAVGLIFDGNIESLEGDYIYRSDYNRTVSVHAGGIMAALKHVYKAKRLVTELETGK
ncbi:MAG: S46 family peptidase [Cytophagales bacterium]|nr:S46 family peptidase [Cytophagales bacterium]